MELTRFSQRLTIIVTMVLGLVGAVVLGKMTAQGRTGPILMVGLGAVGVGLLLALKERIWILLLVAWPMTGQIRALSIPFGVRDLVVFYVFAAIIAMIAFKVIKRRVTPNGIDLTLFLLMLVLIVNYARNPTGVEALGSDRVGGKPYFNVAIALVAWWTVSRCQLGSISPWILCSLLILGRITDGLFATALYFLPGLEGFVSDFYSSPIMMSGMTDSASGPLDEGVGRLVFLGFLGTPLVVAMLALRRPLDWLNLAQPWKPVAFFLAMLLVFKSGFRSALAGVIGVGFISGYIRGGIRDVYKMTGLAALAILLAAAFNGVLFELPKNLQRTLSFLPGNWDMEAVADARESTQWRVFMWQEALLTDRYIENKILGDGFGMKKSDFLTMDFFAKQGTTEGVRENMMIAGNFHSGPISTIRYVGCVGLVIYIILLALVAKEAWFICRTYLSNRYGPFAMLVGLPLIFEPVSYVFIFGSFDSALPDLMFNIGLMKVLRSSLKANSVVGALTTEPESQRIQPLKHYNANSW